MKSISLTVAGLLLMAGWAQAAEEKAQRSYRWVDANGGVHYGDSVPAEFARSQTSELNHLGIELRQSPAQLSPAEALSAEERSAAAARQKQHDQFLMSTYTSPRDIEQLRDERVGLVEAQITAARGFLTAAESRMKLLEQRAQNFRPYATSETARRMPDPLAEELVRTLNEERQYRTVMQRKTEEKDKLRTAFQADIDRYQVLVARRSAQR
jgi:uncharacterized protein DUF4124